MFKFHKSVPLNNWNPYALAVGMKEEQSDYYSDGTTMHLMIHDDHDSIVKLENRELIVLRNLLLEMCPVRVKDRKEGWCDTR